MYCKEEAYEAELIKVKGAKALHAFSNYHKSVRRILSMFLIINNTPSSVNFWKIDIPRFWNSFRLLLSDLKMDDILKTKHMGVTKTEKM